MSALARYFLKSGVEIYGYDLTRSSLTKKLEAEGMRIHYDDDIDQIPDEIELVVYTPAIPDDHKELNWFRANGYTIKKRAEVLGMLSNEKRTIAVAGTHGKTSTSSIISHVLKYCGLDISAFLGGILAEQETNFIFGSSEFVVLEADEYDRSFLQLEPEILIISSLDADHLDIYGDHSTMLRAYETLCSQIKKGGILILMQDFGDYFSEEFHQKMHESQIKVLTAPDDFGFVNTRINNERFVFDYYDPFGELGSAVSTMPGEHNVSNCSAAILVARQLGMDNSQIKKALDSFKGIHRRFEIVHDSGFTLIDDYAHHPTELNKAVTTIKQLYPDRKVLAVFQAHLYSRTQDFYREFAYELEPLNEIWILDIYPAREEQIPEG